MNGILYEEDYLSLFLLVTVVMGGGAAWLAGRAIAATWRPWWHVAFYMLILGGAVRFIHFALFEARCSRRSSMQSIPLSASFSASSASARPAQAK